MIWSKRNRILLVETKPDLQVAEFSHFISLGYNMKLQGFKFITRVKINKKN